MPEYNLNDGITIDAGGAAVRATIVGEENEDGLIAVETEQPVDGKQVHLFTRDQLNGMVQTATDADGNTIYDRNAVPEDETQTDGEAEQKPSGTQQPESSEQPSALSRIPKDEKGKPVFTSVDAATAWDGMVEYAKGKESVARTYADGMVSRAEKELKKAKEAKSIDTDDFDALIASEEQREANIARAQELLDKWTAIAGEQSRREAEAKAAEQQAAEERRKKEESSAINNTMDTADASMGERNDTATPQDTAFEGNGTESFSNTQEDGGENLQAAVASAEQETDRHPTDAQKESGNYKKGHVKVAGFDLTIENPKGSERSGKDADGKEWSTTMQNTYGYIRGTEGTDGDHIDAFLADGLDNWDGSRVFVVDQYNPDGTFDEHKVMLGFNNSEDAYAAYLSNYENGWENGRKLHVSEVPMADFKKWIDSSHRKTKPFEEYKSATKVADNAQQEQGADMHTGDSAQKDETKPTLADVISTLYAKGKEAASKLFNMKFFDVAKTPNFMKEYGLTGDKFTIRYGVISRHFGKDAEHNLPQEVWEQLPQALQEPLAISKFFEFKEDTDGNKVRKQKGYRIYTELKLNNGSYVVVSAEVKNVGRDIEVNAINTIFGRTGVSKEQEEIVYTKNGMTPEQKSLLNGNNPHQYPTAQESSAGKGTENYETSQENGEKNSQSARTTGSSPVRRTLPEAKLKATEKVAKALGVNVKWVDTHEANGEYDPETRTITIARDAENPLVTVFGHEATHSVKHLSDEAYEALRDAMKSLMGEKAWNDAVAETKDLYAEKKMKISDAAAEEEVVCDAVGRVIFEKDGAERLAKYLSRNGLTRVMSTIYDTLKKMWNALRGGDAATVDRLEHAMRVIEQEFDKAAKAADRRNAMPGDVLTNVHGDELAEVDGEGNLRPKYSYRTYRTWKDNLGMEHQGTRERIMEYLQNKQMPKAQIDKFMATMDYWADLNEKVANLVDEDGNFKFKAFHEWSQQTPLYRQNEEGVVRAVSTLVSNGEYPLNFELTTDCIKREAFTQILNEMLKFDGRFFEKMTAGKIVDIQNLEKSYGIQVACPLCFVEGKRLGILNWAKKVTAKWNEALYEVTGRKRATAFGFGTDTYVPEKPLREETPEKQQAIIRQLNEVSNLLSSRKGVLPEDLKIMRRNQRAADRLLQQFKDEYAAKHDGSVEGFVLTKAQEGELNKQMNKDMTSAKARMVKAMTKYPELRHRLDVKTLLGSKGLMAIRSQNGEAFEQMYSLILSANGTGTPKIVQDAQPYDGEIIDVSESRMDKAAVVGGARLFSFSDFDLTKVFDIMQIMFDCAAREAKVQIYSKEVPYILMFGKCGVKINMSMLPEARPSKSQVDAYKKAKNKDGRDAVLHDINENAGLEMDEDGKILGMQLSSSHSVSQEFAEAIYHNPEYNKNCGAIMVGISANHTIYAMCQDFIRQVIPFHLSGMPVAARKKTDCIYYKDFTDTQNTGVIVNGKRVKLINGKGKSMNPKVDSDFNFYEGENEPGWNMRDRCREYIKWCRENDCIPRFEWAVNSDGYRKWCQKQGYTPNEEIIAMMDARTTDGVFDEYYKVITDYTAYSPVFNEKGEQIGEEAAPHKPVTADFGITPQTLSMVLGVDETGKNINDNSMLANRERSIENADRNKKEIAMKAVEMLRGNMTLEDALKEGGTEFENNADNDIFMEQTQDGKKFSLRRGKVSQEEQRIIESAKAAGTYMKAPNGKPSKLNAKQWVQVRTKAFKEWFGDWEKAARIAKLRESKPIEITGEEYNGKYDLNRDSAKEWIKGNLRGTYTNADTGETIEVRKDGLQKVTSHSAGNEAHLKSLVAIPELIERSVFITELPNEKGNGKYDAYRYYVCGMKIGGEDYTVKVTIGVKGASKYYDHALTQIEKRQAH